MNVLQLGLCLFGKHQRSRRWAKQDERYVRSICTGCGVPMIRGFHGWSVDTGSNDAAALDSKS